MTNTNTRKEVTEFTRLRMENRVEMAADNLKSFKESLDKDAVHALSWSLDTFHSQANAKAARFVLNALKEEKSLEHILAVATREAMRSARFPARSSSPTSNLMEQMQGAAWAEIVDVLEGAVEALEE